MQRFEAFPIFMVFIKLQDSRHFGIFKKHKKLKQSKKYSLILAILTGHFASTVIFRIYCEVHGFITLTEQAKSYFSEVTQI